MSFSEKNEAYARDTGMIPVWIDVLGLSFRHDLVYKAIMQVISLCAWAPRH
jgi:hypothetical protein